MLKIIKITGKKKDREQQLCCLPGIELLVVS